MPVWTLLLGSFTVGLAFSISRSRDASRLRALVVVSLFSLLLLAPAMTYLAAVAPDWLLGYFLPSTSIGPWAALSMGLIATSACPAGFLSGLHITHVKHWPIAPWLTILGGLGLIPTLLRANILSVHGSYEQVLGDFGTRSLAGGPLGYSLLLCSVIVGIGAIFTLRILRDLDSSA